MKLGEITDPIYSLSFAVQDGYKTPSYPFDEAVKVLQAIDGSIIDVINFGAREHRTAEFTLNWIQKADFYSLMAYLEENAGQKIRVEKEDTGEHVFGELLPGPVWYAYVAAAEPLGESGYDSGRRLYAYNLQLEYAGATVGAVPNPLDASQYDFFLKGDCVQATEGCVVASKAALDALTGRAGGDVGLTTDTLKVYIYNPKPNTNQGHPIGPGWDFMYTLPPNDPAMGLKNGVIRLSAFADVSAASAGSGGEDWKSGWIAYRGIQFPHYSVDAKRGPAVEHPEGFRFSLDNSTEIWKFPVENNIPFYGSKWALSVYDRAAGRRVLVRTGYNNQNVFESALLHFIIEPGILFQNKSFPSTQIGPQNYPGADKKMLGQPVIATYGRFEKGEIQAVAFSSDLVRFANGRRFLHLNDFDAGTLSATLDIDAAYLVALLGYPLNEYPASNSRMLYVSIYSQDDQPDEKQLRKVTALVAPTAGETRFTLAAGFAVAPDSTSIWVVYLSNNELIIDDDACIGLRAGRYWVEAAATGEKVALDLWAKGEGDSLKRVPVRAFRVVEDGQENRLTVDSSYLSLEQAGELVIEDSVKLDQIAPSFLHGIVDKQGIGYGYFPFGFSPDGIDSYELDVYPVAKIGRWGNAGQMPMAGALSSIGGALACYSSTFTTLIWSTYPGAVSYNIRRMRIFYQKADWASSNPRAALDVFSTNNAVVKDPQLDVNFGDGSTPKREDGSTTGMTTAVQGVWNMAVTGGLDNILIDDSVDTAEAADYEYWIEPVLASGDVGPTAFTNGGKNRPVQQGAFQISAVGTDQGYIVAWSVPGAQQSVTVKRDNTPEAGMPITSSTRGWYKQSGGDVANGQKYTLVVSINCLTIGAAGDTWILEDGIASDHGAHRLLATGGSLFTPYTRLRDSTNCDLKSADGMSRAWGIVVKHNLAGLSIPSAAMVYSELYKVDHAALGDMSNAKEARILFDRVVRSWVGGNTGVNIIIQVRGLKRDKSTSFTIQRENLQLKAPTESGSFGAYAQFLNLPAALGGEDVNYDTESAATNADGLYTGKDLWKLPDYLFEDGAFEWSETEYIMISVTNAAPIPYASVAPTSGGWHLGFGGPPGKAWAVVRRHKPGIHVQYIAKFSTGLDKPLWGRIDGGVKDDSDGTITGTPDKIIEKARHIVDHVVNSTLGNKPVYLGSETKSRDGWIWRWQTKESKPLMDVLNLLIRNFHGIITFTADDRICIRPYGVDEPGVNPVFEFTESNILIDSFGDPEYKKRNEIYQRLRLMYGPDPSQGNKPIEEMNIGYDMATATPLFGGYRNLVEKTDGSVEEQGGLDGLDTLCRLSTYLYASGGKTNEFGVGAGNEQTYELFYRPTEEPAFGGTPVEKTLPNLTELWGPGVMTPKASMQALARLVTRSLCFDSWYFAIGCSMRNVIYNADVQGIADEAGTPEHRIKLGDLVTVTGKKTGGQTLRGLVLGMDLQGLYDGQAILYVFCPRPPGQFGPFVDPRWDAGKAGPRNTANMVFKGDLYGLLNEAGTFPNAGAAGPRNTTQMRFADGTYADAKGSGSGKE